MRGYRFILESQMKSFLAVAILLSNLSICLGAEGITAAPSPAQRECVLVKQDLIAGQAPSGDRYIRCTIPQQIQYYRKVYDDALQSYDGNVKALESQPIPGLFLILENMFALADKHISRETQRNIDKAPYKQRIKEIWAEIANLEGHLTNIKFHTTPHF